MYVYSKDMYTRKICTLERYVHSKGMYTRKICTLRKCIPLKGIYLWKVYTLKKYVLLKGMSTREAGNDWWCRQRLVMQPETERGDPELERAYERWLPPNLSSHYCLKWDRSCELEDIHRRLEYCFCFGKLFGWNSCNICHVKPFTTMTPAWTSILELNQMILYICVLTGK